MNRTTKRLVLACAAAALVLAAGGPADAGQRRPLPALVLADLSGAPAEEPALPNAGTWLLVYVRPACGGCDTLLELLNEDERPQPRRIAIVVAGPAEAAQALKVRYPNVAAARWLLDADGSAARALAAPAAPAVWGVRNQTIEWDLAGPLRGGAELESVLFSWLGRN